MHIDFARRAQIPQLIQTARSQVVLTVPDPVTRFDDMADIAAAESQAAVGVEVLVYVSPSAQRPEKTDLARLARAGVQVRRAANQLSRMTVVDQTLLVVARNRRDYCDGGLVWNDLLVPSMILRSLTAEAPSPDWIPEPPEAPEDQAVPEPLARDVIRQLVQGAKDEVGARELGLGLRTYQRLVARIMDQVDARSRFQAGYRLAQQQLA